MSLTPDDRMLAHLLPALEPHGIGADRLTLTYEDDLQDYDILISGDLLSDVQMEAVLAATTLGGCVRFANPVNEARWYEITAREGEKLLKARAAPHPDVPRFDRSTDTLPAFARSLERWAGLEPGSALKVTDDRTVMVDFQGTPPDFARFTTLMQALDGLSADGVTVLLIGRSAP